MLIEGAIVSLDEQATKNRNATVKTRAIHNGILANRLRVRAVTHKTTGGAPKFAVQVQHLCTAQIANVYRRGGCWSRYFRIHRTSQNVFQKRLEYIKASLRPG
jgi:hypothetical protein